MRHLLLLSLVIFAGLAAEAQSFYSVRRDRSLMAVAGLNTSTYYGDLKDNSDLLDAKPSVTLGLMYYVNKRIAARAEFSWITLSGADANSKEDGKLQRNLSFSSGNYELAVTGLVNLIPQGGRFYQRPTFNVYAFGGLGGLYFNPKAKLNGDKYALRPLKTEGVEYSRFSLVIPYGLGVKYKLSPYFNGILEVGWRKTFTDYIDDVSSAHVDNASFTDPIARQLADRRPEIGLPVRPAGAKRGDPTNDDAYMLVSAKLEYYLPYRFNSNRKLYRSKRKAIYR